MRITKEGHAYIQDFAEKAAKIFDTFGFYYGAALGVQAYVPTIKELVEKITVDVSEFKRQESHFSICGRILVTGWDSAPWFRLFIDLKEPVERMNCVEKDGGQK